ncbi:hypothetical protein AVEN_270492-1 [Araneus ventricosus]|uniref:Uncharacterized protein n=1 Tax=Araneus ventricosus TaxID=182803 RepID=A0A4Y2B5Y1_ARAVE|nr:hypothetical protein AVEN_270492-1 [Araneus ventricosus]
MLLILNQWSYLNSTLSSSSYTDTDVITLEYQSQNRLDFPTIARECDRYGISVRAFASVDSIVSQDIGNVHQGVTSHLVDRNKIRRQRKKHQNVVAKSSKLTVSRSVLTGFYFDGRKDKTKC